VTDNSLKVVPDQEETKFGDILFAISAEKKLNQLNLSLQLGYSQPSISRIEKGTQPVSPKLALKLAEVLGGDSEEWLQVFHETVSGSPLPIKYFRDRLLGAFDVDDLPGTRIRRMRKQDIVRFFGSNPNGVMTFRGVEESCEIADFEEGRVEETSYDTRVGSYYEVQPNAGEANRIAVEIEECVTIPAGGVKEIVVKEHITLPPWLELDIHPASNIAKKNLIVSNGPIVDPGFDGPLIVSVFNPTPWDREITVIEPFLTLRFWMQDSH